MQEIACNSNRSRGAPMIGFVVSSERTERTVPEAGWPNGSKRQTTRYSQGTLNSAKGIDSNYFRTLLPALLCPV